MSVTKWWAHLVDSNIVTAMIADLAVTTGKIADLAVTTAKIAADAITGAQLADNAVDSEHYVDGSIDPEHLAAQAAGDMTTSGFGGSAALTGSYVSFQTLSITPKRTTSKITIRASVQHLFVSGTTTMRISRSGSLVGAEKSIAITTDAQLSATETPGTTSSITYSVDVKNDAPAGAAGGVQITLIEAV